MDVEDRAGLSSDALAAIVAAVARQRTLEDVLAWAHAQLPAFEVAEVVVQDEFTHDVVLAIGAGRYLVYDTT